MISTTYVASQAASVAEAYDPEVPKELFSTYELSSNTRPEDDSQSSSAYANFQRTGVGYLQTIDRAANSLVNFYNPRDLALNWEPYTWRGNQILKPDDFVDYNGDWVSYDWEGGSFVRENPFTDYNLAVLNLGLRNDRYEVFSYAAQPRSLALGAMAVAGPFTENVNITSSKFGFDDFKDHSGQFSGVAGDRKLYWITLAQKFSVGHVNA